MKKGRSTGSHIKMYNSRDACCIGDEGLHKEIVQANVRFNT